VLDEAIPLWPGNVADKVKAVPGIGVGRTICGPGAGGSSLFGEIAADACACERNGTSNSVSASMTNKIAHCLAFIRQAFQILKIEISFALLTRLARRRCAGSVWLLVQTASLGSFGVERHAGHELDLQSRRKAWLSYSTF
jgi:hypothetical protein